jgi:hypothetical protein
MRVRTQRIVPRAVVAVVALVMVAGCTTVQEVRRPGGGRDFLIACGSSTGWNVCYRRANELCPSGWTTVRQDGGFNRKEMVISCPLAPPAGTQPQGA